jgi:hypothetical protein
MENNFAKINKKVNRKLYILCQIYIKGELNEEVFRALLYEIEKEIQG